VAAVLLPSSENRLRSSSLATLGRGPLCKTESGVRKSVEGASLFVLRSVETRADKGADAEEVIAFCHK